MFLRTIVGTLLVLSTAAASAAVVVPTDAQKDTHFAQVKVFALTSITQRQSVLEQEKRCVEQATTLAMIKKCHEGASQQREQLKQVLQPQYEKLKR